MDNIENNDLTQQAQETVEIVSEKASGTKAKAILKEILSWILSIGLGVGAAIFLTQVVVVNATVPSGSMENTVMIGDRLIGSRLAYKNADPERFDIIFFKYPDDETRVFIKRVIGLPGETVTVKDGKVYIDDSTEPLDDSFIAEPMIGDFGPYEVPENSYFCMGDNRNSSLDSRYWNNKFVAKDKILGKALFRYWPLNSIGKIE